MILAGDIGGTHTRLAVFNGRLKPQRVHVFNSNDYENLEEPLSRFVKETGARVERACFGVAGPVVRGRAKVTNLKWVVDATRLARELRVRGTRLRLINDLQANAAGVALLGPKDLVTLNRGAAREGNRAIIAAGTGLGEAGLFWDGATHRPVASEGGHAGFAPTSNLQDRLLAYLRPRDADQFHGHVSYERVLSGRGLVRIYEFLTHARVGKASGEVSKALKANPSAAIISKAALDGRCPRCEKALDLFVDIYGAEAGNLALQFVAVGGLYVGGGIAPKIVRALKRPTFMTAFKEKGPMRRLLERIPVHVILNDKTALLGAARVATEMN